MSPDLADPTARAKGIGLLMVQAMVSSVVVAIVFPQIFKGVGCGLPCTTVIWTAFLALLWVVAGIFAISVAAVIVLSLRGHESWRVPAVGIALVVASGIITTIAIIAA